MKGWSPAVVLLALATTAGAADPSRRFVYPGPDGRLVYDVHGRGNRIPDFSHCGYRGGGVALPEVPVQATLAATPGDNTARIQATLDHVAGLAPDKEGFRGAVLLLAGRYEVAGSLRLTKSGVVLRGQGQGPNGTHLVATGLDRRTLIQARGGARPSSVETEKLLVTDEYVPVGSYRLRLSATRGLQVGDTVLIEHPGTREWIAALGMDRFPSRDKGSWLDWQPGKLNQSWDRVITEIEGNTITVDAPLTSALDATLGRASFRCYSWPGRIERIGIENLRCESTWDARNPLDEQHAWGGVCFENVRDAWVRQVTFAHFAGSAVAVYESCKQITVEDCTSLRPVSEIGGYRRHTFYTSGQLTLFQRCQAEHGRHDFAVGYLAAGPNAFVQCSAREAHQYSGPIESWATGVLYDNVTMDGGGLALTNRETDGHGVGWAAANCVLWQCTAPVITCRMPPTGQNWAIGCWGQFVGDGHWRSLNEFVKPDSLYASQLADRLGAAAVENLKRREIPTTGDSQTHSPGVQQGEAGSIRALTLRNGWLTVENQLLIGRRGGTVWWRGHILPSRASEMGPGVTRFVPGRDGPGFTDDLETLTDSMHRKGQAVLEHHWGLWYDRRRDDHQMVRRMDGDVWPPFYEQPWARSGQGRAWDGLSRYDLTRFNPWYFDRLDRFARQCARKGLVLVQQMYFQHNILEAGAHWADFPWRPANCLQDTGFPEPPPYVNNKRVFMAEAFYDVSHPVRRELHRAYIRHCLDVLGKHPNVIFQTGEEFTGPRAFVEFWHDTIAEWEREKGRRVLIGLSCTKDVQDAILADPLRGPRVSIIDLRYWWYTANGGVYDPKGNTNLAPRQQLREWQGSKSRSEQSVARQVREYRLRYPEKAILYSVDATGPWAVLAAGGSIPNLPSTTDAALLAAIPEMTPVAVEPMEGSCWVLGVPSKQWLVYLASGSRVRLDVADAREPLTTRRIDLKTGSASAPIEVVQDGRFVELRSSGSGATVYWLTRS